jgi:RimJ/RimL family protein N-acetyltransferase
MEIAWRFGRPLWGQGIATEAARTALEFGLANRDLDRIVAVGQVGNGASEHVMQKLAMRLERQTTDPASGRQVRVYEITRTEFLAGPGRTAATGQ